MKLRILLLCILCIFYSLSVCSQRIITGSVVTSKNTPLEGASIYLNNTSIGTTTNENGEFELRIDDGNYDLIVSYIGFETIQYALPKNQNQKLLFRMMAKTNMLDEVVISNKEKMSKEDRAYFMRRFKQSFLGKTSLAEKCVILNEHVIDFDFDLPTKTLEASCSQPIIIENKGLGYRILYDLVHFQLTNTNIEFLGYSRYQKLKGSKRKQKKWTKKRRIAYEGSTMHFLRSLIEGNTKEEGFIIDHFKKILNPARPHDSIIEKARESLRMISTKDQKTFSLDMKKDSILNILRLGRLKKTINVSIQKDVDPNYFIRASDTISHISFTDFLKVKFMKEKEELNYRPGNVRLDHQVSVVSLLVKSSSFDKLGVLIQPLDLFLDGYWSYEKLADTLPLDYNHNESN